MSTTSRSRRKRPTTASSRTLTRRRFLAGSALLPALTPPGLLGIAAPGGPQSTAQRDGFPYAIVLGTSQDAGVPQVNCFSTNCEAVRRGDRPPPRVACLGIVDPAAGRRFIIDATPDFVAQVGDLLAQPPGAAAPEGMVRLEEQLHGVFLTHGHMGHYTGLIHVGREGAATRELPLYVSQRMAAYLGANEPWAFLLRNGHVRVGELMPGEPVVLTASLSITPIDVLHRQELTDTLGYLVVGPRRSLLYVPDADRWEGWTTPFERWIDAADIALLDGSFWSHDELGHRPQGEVPHPPVSTTVELLRARADAGIPNPETWFIHLNHTNPLWDPVSPERSELRIAGHGVATTGQMLAL